MRAGSAKTALAAIAVVAILVAPMVFGRFTTTLLIEIGISALVALGLVLLTGVGGATSFGQAAFVGLAAYTTALLTRNFGLSPWIGLICSLLLTGLVAFVIGALTLQLGGHFLAISTIAWGIAIPIVFANLDILGSHTGISGIPPVSVGAASLQEPERMYYLVWAFVAGALLFSRNLLDSRLGRAMRSLRGGESLLGSVGANAFRVRLTVFVLAALFAALAGWLYAHANRYVSPTPFGVEASIEYLLMAVIGGLGSLAGAVIGAAVILLLKNGIQDLLPLLTSRGAQLDVVVFSLLFILLMHFARGGLVGVLQRAFGQRVRGATVPDAVPGREAADCGTGLPRRHLPLPGREILRVDAASKRFGGLMAVDKVSFTIGAAQIVGLIGPNGAGKSTMFDLLSRNLPMTGGKVAFLGADVSGASQPEVARMGLGRTFQHVRLRPAMTLLDNVALGAFARGRANVLASGLRLNRNEERRIFAVAREQLDRIGLGHLAQEQAGKLPLGTQRILEIARALASDPILLILDEPAAGLRAGEKRELAALLRELRTGGVTILIVEHDMDFVMNLVDRLVVMNFGSKLAEGTPAVIRKDPAVQDAYLGGVV